MFGVRPKGSAEVLEAPGGGPEACSDKGMAIEKRRG